MANQLYLGMAEKIEDAYDDIQAVRAQAPRSVARPLGNALDSLNNALSALDTAIGNAARNEDRERRRKPPTIGGST